jgi:hypothetical protein
MYSGRIKRAFGYLWKYDNNYNSDVEGKHKLGSKMEDESGVLSGDSNENKGDDDKVGEEIEKEIEEEDFDENAPLSDADSTNLDDDGNDDVDDDDGDDEDGDDEDDEVSSRRADRSLHYRIKVEKNITIWASLKQELIHFVDLVKNWVLLPSVRNQPPSALRGSMEAEEDEEGKRSRRHMQNGEPHSLNAIP